MPDRFKQKSGELLLTWMVQLHNLGVTGVGIDPGDSRKFMTWSSDSFIQEAFKETQLDTKLLSVVAEKGIIISTK